VDNDGLGDACDDNDDGDDFPDDVDNCDLVANNDQADWDEDDVGDVCDDSDGDTKVDAYDNCVTAPNFNQSNIDGDGTGDVCDPDIDGDGVWNFPQPDDNCPLDPNPFQDNGDLDAFGDACDLCPDFFSNVNTDFDADGIGDPCDSDADGDNVDDSIDNCLFLKNEDQADIDGNGVGFQCDEAEQNMLERPIDAAVFIPEDLPFEVPVLVCPNCGGQRLPVEWQVSIDFNLDAAAYAQVVDSQGEVIARSLNEAGANHDFNFDPVLFSGPAVAADVLMDQAATRQAHDSMAYTLEIYPLEDPSGERNYTLTWDKEQGQPRFIVFLPGILR
jgi:hypothetical protein